MAMDIQSQLSATDRGSFFKLVDAFASELGELKQEMVEINQQEDEHPEPVLLYEMEGEVSGLYLQCPKQEGERDCGSASWASRMSVLDRLMETHPVWLLLSINEPEAISILLHQPPGAFLVRRSPQLQSKVLSVRVDDTSESPVTDYPVKESQYTFALEDSGISFADLFHLVAFYCVSRDVLPFTLRIPEVIAMATTQAELGEVAQLGAGFWRLAISSPRRSPPPAGVSSAWPRVPWAAGPDQTLPRPESSAQPPPAARVLPTPHQRGSSHAALCFINPLFLHIHHPLREDPPRPRHRGRAGCPDGRSRSSPPPPPLPRRLSPPQRRSMPLIGSCGRARQPQSQKQRIMGAKASSTDKPAVPPPWPKKQGEALEGQRFPIALDEETIARALSRANLPYKGPAAKPAPTAKTVPWTRRTGSNQRLSDVSLSTSTSSDSLDSPRVPPPGLAEDSSDEDVDEDGDEDEAEEDYGAGLENDLQLRLRASRHSKRLRRGGPLLILPRALKGRFRKVSGVFNSLMTPERRAVRKITELSRDKGSYFGCLVQDYMSFLQENYKSHTSSLDMLQTLRQFLTQMKAYLQQSSELDPPIESLIPEDQIDHVLERAMHKCVLKPLQAVVEAALHDFQVGSGAWQQLVENLALAKARQPHELGVEAALPPDAAAIEKIRHKFQNMRKMYSPEQKVTLLLRICKLIYTIMQEQSGRMFGADDFLPMLTYVVAQCDMPQLDTEIQYMMELLEPSLLHGEGGYYLTSVYGAMALIKNFQEEQAARILSLATRNTLHQWHQRRTTQRNTPSVEDFQNYLRVALQDVGNGCTAKTLQVLPYATTEEVCRLCAKKFRVADPESHALFLLTEDTSQQLAPDTHPQLIKAEFHSRPQPQPFHFVYRRVGSTITTTTSHTEQRHNGNCPPA